MTFVFYVFELISYSINLFFLLKKIYDVDINIKSYFVSIFAILIGLIISIFSLKYQVVVFIFVLSQVLQICFLKLFSKKIRFGSILLAYGFIYSINLILCGSVKCLFRISDEFFILLDFIINIIVLGISCIFYFNATLLYKLKYLLKVVSKSVKILIIISCLFNGFYLVLISVNPLISEAGFWNTVVRWSSVILSVIFLTILPMCIVISINNSYLKSQNEQFQRDIEAQAKHYSDLAKANYELRRFKHDFGNMKIGLSQYLKEKDCAGALDMLNSAAIDMQRSSDDIVGFDTGNGIVDAILADKQSRAKTNNIKIIFSGSVPPNSIAPTDLCIIFGNTLDNAIEACEKISDDTEKIIFVTCRCNSGFVFIDITNPVAEDVLINGINVETSKPDKASHGYGLYSLNKTVKKLDGEVKLSCENKIFKVEIDFSIEQNIIYA